MLCYAMLLLDRVHGRVHAVAALLTNSLCRRQVTGGLAAPSAILSRAFQELSNARLGFNSAMKIASTPFPFPYAQQTVVLVLVLMFTTPLAVAAFVPSAGLAFTLTFFTVGGFHALAEISFELEAPFGGHANELPLELMHDQYNRDLEALLDPQGLGATFTTSRWQAELDGSAATERRSDRSAAEAEAAARRGSRQGPGTLRRLDQQQLFIGEDLDEQSCRSKSVTSMGKARDVEEGGGGLGQKYGANHKISSVVPEDAQTPTDVDRMYGNAVLGRDNTLRNLGRP